VTPPGSSSPFLRRAVFLDRDGVVNRDSPAFIKSPEELEMLPGAAEAIARLERAGFVVAVVTNQSGIGRGLFTEEALARTHARLIQEVEAAGGRIHAIRHCPHLPDAGCACRKPLPGLVEELGRDLQVDLASSFFVGDRPEDIQCGTAAGATSVLVLTGNTDRWDPERFPCAPAHVARDLPAAVEWILAQPGAPAHSPGNSP